MEPLPISQLRKNKSFHGMEGNPPPLPPSVQLPWKTINISPVSVITQPEFAPIFVEIGEIGAIFSLNMAAPIDFQKLVQNSCTQRMHPKWVLVKTHSFFKKSACDLPQIDKKQKCALFATF